MESERRRYELRSGSRSRSRTPLVQNNALAEPEHTESHYDLRSCSRERSRTPGEVTSSRKSGSRSLPGSVGKTRDRSTEMIAEKREETASQTQSIKSEGSMVVGAKKVERRSERQKAKRQIFANGQSVSRDGSSVGDTGERRRSASPRRVLTSDYSSEEGEREDPPSRPGSAYEIYKQAGDWWNVFPKTDYTYSEKSQCRYEIAPGVLAMPNMSRRSIHSDCASSTIGSAPSTSQQNLSQSSQETTESGIGDVSDMGEAKETAAESLTTLNTSYGSLPKTRTWDSGARSAVYTKTHVERYKSHREIVYTVPGSSADLRQRSFSRPGTPPATRCIESRKYGISSTFDSDAELDDAVSVSSNKRLDTRWRMTRWVSTIVAFFVLSFAKLLQVLKVPTIIGNQERRATHDYRRYHDSRWTRMWRYIDHSSSQYIYLLMVKIFFFDSWLLSRVSNVRRWLQDRGPKVVWIALLPLLLLAGIYIVQTQSFIRLGSLRNIPYGVTETTYQILNDINELTSFEYELLVKYITNLKNSSLHLLPDVNVSLPEMPSIGWNLQW